jgi:hypothetical protein
MCGSLFIVRTFITYGMCSGLQQQEFEACRVKIMNDQEMYDRIRLEYMP